MDDRTREQDADHRFTPRAIEAFIAAQYGKWQAVAKDANIKVD